MKGKKLIEGIIAYDCSSDHGCVELCEADADGKADLASLGKGQEAYDCECLGTRPFPGVFTRPCDECDDEDEKRLDERGQDQPASFSRSDAVRKLSEY